MIERVEGLTESESQHVLPNGHVTSTPQAATGIKPHRQSIVEQMKSRIKELSILLNGYQQIEEEFRSLSRALKILTGEEYVGRPKLQDNKPRLKALPGQGPAKGTMRYRMLEALGKGLALSSEVAKDVGCKQNQISTYLTRLVEKGWAVRTGSTSRDGRRVATYALSANGKALLTGHLAKVDIRKRMSTTDVLTILAKDSASFMRAVEICDALGSKDQWSKSRAAVNLAYLKSKGWAISKEGAYRITSAGKSKLAEELQKS